MPLSFQDQHSYTQLVNLFYLRQSAGTLSSLKQAQGCLCCQFPNFHTPPTLSWLCCIIILHSALSVLRLYRVASLSLLQTRESSSSILFKLYDLNRSTIVVLSGCLVWNKSCVSQHFAFINHVFPNFFTLQVKNLIIIKQKHLIHPLTHFNASVAGFIYQDLFPADCLS